MPATSSLKAEKVAKLLKELQEELAEIRHLIDQLDKSGGVR
jgi:hypothetical protein